MFPLFLDNLPKWSDNQDYNIPDESDINPEPKPKNKENDNRETTKN